MFIQNEIMSRVASNLFRLKTIDPVMNQNRNRLKTVMIYQQNSMVKVMSNYIREY